MKKVSKVLNKFNRGDLLYAPDFPGVLQGALFCRYTILNYLFRFLGESKKSILFFYYRISYLEFYPPSSPELPEERLKRERSKFSGGE